MSTKVLGFLKKKGEILYYTPFASLLTRVVNIIDRHYTRPALTHSNPRPVQVGDLGNFRVRGGELENVLKKFEDRGYLI